MSFEDLEVLCRVCLSEQVRMHSIMNTELQEFYEKITNLTLHTVTKPMLLCYMCYSQLRSSHQFTLKASLAEEVLLKISNGEKQISSVDKQAFNHWSRFSTSTIEHCSIIPSESTMIQQEPIKYEQSVLKFEGPNTGVVEFECPTGSESDSHIEPPGSDPEDDIPLKDIIKKPDAKVPRAKKQTAVKKRKQRNKETKFEAHEVILSKEEQLQELEARSKSLNYLNSPYKCELCYKGFVDIKAFDNHMEKHDERRGAHECPVCRARYGSRRQLRAHALAAHARRYPCARAHCAYTAHTHNQARDHERWHSGYTYDCQLCSQKFRKPTSYLTHMRKSHPTEHICNICGESFVGRHGLLMHKSKAHKPDDENPENPEEPASDRYCSDCNIQFVTILAWKKHLMNSVKHLLGNETSSQCRICDQNLPAGVSLSSHMKEHQKSLQKAKQTTTNTGKLVQLACDQCGANFYTRSKLQAHVKRIHLGFKYNKNIVCEVCGKKCTSNATLKYHQRTHTGERPYACASCPKRFADNNHLRLHSRTHSGERPYCCAACGRRFTQRPALTRHYRVHTGAKPYVCEFCSKSFSQSSSLKLHVRTVHLKIPSIRKNKTQKVLDAASGVENVVEENANVNNSNE